MTKKVNGASKKAVQRQGMPKVLKTFSVVEESPVVVSEEAVASVDVTAEECVWVNPPEVDMEPVDDYAGDVSEEVVPDVVLPPLESVDAPEDMEPVDVSEGMEPVVPGVEAPRAAVRGGVSIRELMAERASEAAAVVSSALSGDKVGVRAALAARGVNGSTQSVKRAVRARMHGGDALRGQNKCTTKVIG